MTLLSINPATGQTMAEFKPLGERELSAILQQVADATPIWAAVALGERCRLMQSLAETLRQRSDDLARLITEEMGKLLRESQAEVEKCAGACEYYAEHAADFLADKIIRSDAEQSYIAYQPFGTVLAIMPWNFPLWQVFRFAIPGLLAGNTAVLKHASNVPRCAQAIEDVFHAAGFPAQVLRTLLIDAAQVQTLIADPRIHAVTLTGSEAAGRKVAAQAGANLKKIVLELGGSDPFIVLDDADLELAVGVALKSRFQNAGQSCIAAKRFILLEAIADDFMDRFRTAVQALRPGDPFDESTDLAPLARRDLRDALHEQVLDSIDQGAVPVTGCRPLDGPGAFYKPSILDHVKPGMRAYQEELFGPVAAIIRVPDEHAAVRIANDSRYGLGGSVWTRDMHRGERIARQLQCGNAFVNGLVKSDPRLPFGGVKASGFGRELSFHGLQEFVNIKTVWMA